MNIYNKYYKQIDSYVNAHRDELVDIICRLISFPSVRGDSLPGMPFGKKCADALGEGMKICEEYGMKTYNYENYVAKGTYGEGDKEIGFIAHLDVVPAGGEWKSDPFVGIERDGYIVGRGSRDNKAGFGAALMAINCIRDLNIPINSSLSLIMGSDEENGMSDIEYYVNNYKTPDFSIVTDCLFPVAHGEKGRLCGDINIPFNTDVIEIFGGEAPNIIPDRCKALLKNRKSDIESIRRKSEKYDWVEIHESDDDVLIIVKGISAHASEPYKAENAIWKMAKFLIETKLVDANELEAVKFINDAFKFYYGEYFGIDYEDKDSGKTTLITGMIGCESQKLKINIDCRYSVTDKKERFMPIFLDKIKQLHYTFETNSLTDSHYIPSDNSVVTELTEIFNYVAKEDKKPYVLSGGTYASKVQNSVAFGPGNAKEALSFPYKPGHGDAHQPDESQNINYLMDAVKIYALSIIKLDEILHNN